MSRLMAICLVLAVAVLVGGTAFYTQFVRVSGCGGDAYLRVGGPFELLDATGTIVTDQDVIDGPTLIYFGYSYCPDICPFDVARNAIAVDLASDLGHEVKPVFITIDPERDTPEIIGEYASEMHPRMIGLTGSADQIRSAAEAYRVYYERGTGAGDAYLMDHSTHTYLVDKGNRLLTYFDRLATPEDMAAEVACLLGAQ